jgi:hydroxypyruvate reductase
VSKYHQAQDLSRTFSVRKGLSTELRHDAMEIFMGALADCSPSHLLQSQLRFESGTLIGPDFRMSVKDEEEIFLLALGKAAGSMASAMFKILPERKLSGVAVLLRGARRPPPPIRTLRGSHPIPNANSFRAGRFLLRSMIEARRGRAIVHLISGGASALAASPLAGWISNSDKALLHQLLISSGLGIREINVVRSHFSGIKGGRLAAVAPRTPQITLVLSDVPGDCPEAVGGGPTLPDSSTWPECMEILGSSGILGELPGPLRRRLERPGWPETLKSSAACFRGKLLWIVADSQTLVGAAERQARRLGYATRVLPGSAEESSEAFLDRLLKARESWKRQTRPRCLLAGGEVRIRPQGRGKGGRAQDLALATALRLDGTRGSLFFAAGSDGKDGNSPAAGACCDGRTVLRARRLGLDPVKLRAASNSHRLFRALGDCVMTGPTGNNLRDLYFFLDR